MSIQYYGLITELPEEDAFLEVTADGQDRLVQVKFADSYSLTLYVDEGGSVKVSDVLGREATADSSAALFMIMPSEQPVTVVATSETGYKFIGWQVGTVTPSQNKTFTFTMSANTVLRAVFERSEEDYAIQYFGTPTDAGEYTLQAVDKEGKEVKVIVEVRDTVPVGPKHPCYLIRYDKNGAQKVFYLPNVQSIEEVDSVKITEISSIIYGFDNNFVMDLGVTQSYTINIKRAQPSGWEYTDDWSDDQDKWSNGKWFTELKAFLDDWQNLNYGIVNEDRFDRTGGYRLIFEPPTYTENGTVVTNTELYPPIDRTGFIVGGITMTQSGNNLQYLSVSIPFSVASMRRQIQTAEGTPVKLKPNYSGLSDKSVYFPENFNYPAPSAPREWNTVTGSLAFEYWSYIQDGATRTAYAGKLVDSSVKTLTASWNMPICLKKYDVEYGGEVDRGRVMFSEIPEISGQLDSIKRMRIWLVGGGGCGTQVENGTYPNAGGGSGGYVDQTFGIDLTRYDGFYYIIGRGGDTPYNSSRSGGATEFYLTSSTADMQMLATAGGGGAATAGAWYTYQDAKPGAGGTGGASGEIGDASGTHNYGGRGGAIPDLVNGLTLAWTGGSITLKSTAGYNHVEIPSTPECGGGGGGATYNPNSGIISDWLTENTPGANGTIVVAFYR